MARALRGRDALALCRAVRPEMPDDVFSPDAPAARAMLEELLAMPVETRPDTGPISAPRPRRARPVIALIGSAALAAGAVAAVVELTDASRPTGPSVAASGAADLTRIAATSQTAAGRSGRAHVAFELQAGTPDAQQGTSEVAWSGQDIEMKVHIRAHGRHPASDAWTKTVDGASYAYLGPKNGPRQWVRQPLGPRPGGLFDADPRTLLSILDPAARFTDAGSGRIDGVGVRRLHATAVDHVPAFDLGLWPDAATTSVIRLDLWVGADDVVRRMDLGLRRTDGKSTGGPGFTQDSTYSVTFSDLGAPITIAAPVDPAEVAK